MEVIYGWVKNIVFFYIIMTAVLHLLPKNSYQKYVRFFGGIILVILLLTPLLELLYHPDYLLDKISYQSFLQDMNTMKLDVEGMEQTQKEIFFKEYEEAIANDIKTLSREDLVIEQAFVELTEEYKLKQVRLTVCLTEQKEGIYIEKLILQDNSKEYPKVLEIKEKIMELYEIESDQIQISVREE